MRLRTGAGFDRADVDLLLEGLRASDRATLQEVVEAIVDERTSATAAGRVGPRLRGAAVARRARVTGVAVQAASPPAVHGWVQRSRRDCPPREANPQPRPWERTAHRPCDVGRRRGTRRDSPPQQASAAHVAGDHGVRCDDCARSHRSIRVAGRRHSRGVLMLHTPLWTQPNRLYAWMAARSPSSCSSTFLASSEGAGS